jgi:hypothetical protein
MSTCLAPPLGNAVMTSDACDSPPALVAATRK